VRGELINNLIKVKMKKTIFLVFILSITLFSCNKKDNNITNTQVVNNQSSLSRTETVVNPYNWCGKLHNGALDTLALDKDFPNIDDQDAIKIIENYYLMHAGFTSELTYQDYLDGLNDNPWPFSESIQPFVGKDMMSEDQFDYVLRLEEIYLADSSIDFALSGIHELEVHLYNNEELNTNDKEYVWYMLAISKYSYQYWFNAFTNPENPWYSVVNGSKMPFGRWCAMHAADFWGANHGFWIKGNGRDFADRIQLGDLEAAYASYTAGLDWDAHH
jgi:hypothetical protein